MINRGQVLLGAVVGLVWAQPALAQDGLAGMPIGQLKGELKTRYDAALAASRDTAIVSANDTRYIWAREAATQCAIAIGYTKGGIKDPVSVGKCDDAYQRMQGQPQVAVAVAPPAGPVSDACANRGARTIFFDFDVDTVSPEGAQAARFMAENVKTCNWPGLVVVGHTDRAGSDAYNDALAMRRAKSVADVLVSSGLDPSMISISSRGEHEPEVPTLDGERNPQNRRVAVSVK